MLSRKMLTSLTILLWCGTPSLAQLPKRWERCLSNLMGQETSDVRPLPQTVFVRVASVDFGANSSIPERLRREIRAKLQRERYEEDPESDYLQSAGNEINNDIVAMALKPRGYFKSTVMVKLAELEKAGQDVAVVANISAQLGPQYRLGTITVGSADPDKWLSLKPQALREEFRLQSGEIVNADELRHGFSRLTKIYLEFGFIDMTAEPQFKFDDAKKTIDIVILVDEERQYFVKDVQFWGVDPKLEARLRSKLPRVTWLFNSAVLVNFFKENRSVLPPDVSLEDDVEFHRNPQDGTIALVFDFRPCPGTVEMKDRPD